MPFPSIKTIAAVVLALGLGFTHLLAYKAGRAGVQAQWAQVRQEQAEQALKASELARAQEQALTKKANDVSKQFELEKKRRAADALLADNELRLLAAALAASNSLDPTPTSRPDGDPKGGLLLACAGELAGVAAEADRTGTQLIGLQRYVIEVCK